MPDAARTPDPDGPSRAARRGRKAAVFVVVLVAALLLGRLGSGLDDGPAPEGEQPAGQAWTG